MVDRGGMVLTPLTLHAAMKADPGLDRSRRPRLSRGLAQAAPAHAERARLCAHPCTTSACAATLIRIGEDIVNTAYEAPHDKPPKAQIEEAEKALYQVSEKLANTAQGRSISPKACAAPWNWPKRRRRGAGIFPA